MRFLFLNLSQIFSKSRDLTCRCKASQAKAPHCSWCGVALASRAASIGREYFAVNCRSVPSRPGIRKSNSDHSSSTLFCGEEKKFGNFDR